MMKSLLALCCFVLLLKCADASIINVGKSHKTQTIKKAIELAQPFDTLQIENGIYKEGNLIVAKPLTLLGQKQTILDGENKHEILTISGSYFRIKGITFQNSGYSSMNDFASIKIIDAHDFIIEQNRIINAHFAIHVSNSNRFVIKNNHITGTPAEEQSTGNGIHLWKCSKALIANNNTIGHRDGIYFEFVTESEVLNNYSEKNIRYGLHFMFSNNDKYISNTFHDNGAGVAVMFSHHIAMHYNKFTLNRGGSAYGILLKEISDGEVYANTFSNNTVGVFMEGTNRIHFKHNKFYSNGYAMKVQASCNENNIENNNFTGNTFDVATNGSLVLNTLSKNYWDKYEG
ncbi:MAG TPA: nitrous oxide reductase family maturation protein NosD, partial [Bacteroidia bacterium]|nr:nitrous oxide reductase family maturation protein NosD [Bacteroidia bacterium]